MVDTYKITLWGIVQGVGFRPFVYRLAQEKGLKGYVKNVGGLVEIVLNSTEAELELFIEELIQKKPLPSEIVHVKNEKLTKQNFSEFRIEDSKYGSDEAAMIPADIAVCDECLHEMNSDENRRHMHPFISCMRCGPRYSIINDLPYDRDTTTMVDYPLCAECAKEYADSTDRRHHAQTISCHNCGPYPIYKKTSDTGTESNEIINVEAISAAINDIKEGEIIALKGNGGYYLVCDPKNELAVRKLRQVKGREEKPFAVMFKDVQELKQYALPTDAEIALLKSNASPIVLIERRESDITENVYRSSRFMGAFLPSIGLQYLIISATGPLVMTSANKSDMPIIKDEEEMFKFAEDVGNIPVLYNTRRIITRLDDSVVRIVDSSPQMIRRSKGYVPVPIFVGGLKLNKADTIFAAGADLKGAFALSKANFSYVSEYFGDLDSIEKKQVYLDSLDHLKTLFRIMPKLSISDLHPKYISKDIANSQGIPHIEVQHHHAHIASVMAEHGLTGPVIGFAFDGTGYGEDGKIWGGEVLICEGEKYRRFSHLKYTKMIGGDSSMKEGWKSAVAYQYAEENKKHKLKDDEFEIDISDVLKMRDYEQKNAIFSAIEQGINTFETSSMGRLFDAVASLLGLQDENRYEGECASALENAAYRAMNGSKDIEDLTACDFHERVALCINAEAIRVRDRTKINEVVLSGGVFQNKILMERALELLRGDGFKVYYNISVPPNDGGIALGQNYIGMHSLGNLD